MIDHEITHNSRSKKHSRKLGISIIKTKKFGMTLECEKPFGVKNARGYSFTIEELICAKIPSL